MCAERRLVDVGWPHADLMVPRPQVELGEQTSAVELIDDKDRERVLDSERLCYTSMGTSIRYNTYRIRGYTLSQKKNPLKWCIRVSVSVYPMSIRYGYVTLLEYPCNIGERVQRSVVNTEAPRVVRLLDEDDWRRER